MSKVKQFVKSLRLSQVVVVFLVGVLVLLNTACSRPPAPRVSGESSSVNERRAGNTELYDTIQRPQGGMNQYSDTDPRRNTSSVESKADRLIRSAKNNTSKVDSPRDFAESYRQGTPLNKRVEKLTEDVSESAERAAQTVKEGARENARNLKQNTQNAVEKASDKIENTVNPS